MNLPQVYSCSPSWTLLPPPSPYPPSGSSQCTSPKHPVSCIEPGLATRFIHDNIYVSMPFSQISPPSPSPTESIRLIYTSVSLLLSRTQGYCLTCFNASGTYTVTPKMKCYDNGYNIMDNQNMCYTFLILLLWSLCSTLIEYFQCIRIVLILSLQLCKLYSYR